MAAILMIDDERAILELVKNGTAIKTKSGFKDWILKLKRANPFASWGLTVPANRLC